MVNSLNLKSTYSPVRKEGSIYIVSWNYTPVLDSNSNDTEYATWTEEQFRHKPSIDEIKGIITSEINKETDDKIENGFVWESSQTDTDGNTVMVNVHLSMENQFNYKAAYDLAFQTNGASLPFILKFGETTSPKYYTFNTLQEFTQFYMASISFINTTIADGWRRKDSVVWEDYEDALNNIN